MKTQTPTKSKAPGFNFFETAVDFIIKNRKPISIGGSALLVVVILSGMLLFFNSSQEEKANESYDQAISIINQLAYVTNQQQQIQLYSEQINRLNGLIQSYPNKTAAIRARLFLGKAYFDQAYRDQKPESLTTALEYYKGILNVTQKPFYRALANMGLAACYEQRNQFDQAFTNYKEVVEKYPNEGFNPVALIGMARCKEIKGMYQDAILYYRKIATEETNSYWVRYAKGKLYSFSIPASTTNVPVQQNQNTASQTNIKIINPQK